jgi:putative NADH-flavin reductase
VTFLNASEVDFDPTIEVRLIIQKMKIAIIGASGFVGQAVLHEALSRGYEVTGISRDTSTINTRNPKLSLKNADAFETDALAKILRGHDAVLSTYNAGWNNPNLYADFLKGSESIERAVEKSGVKRFLVMGGAGSLEVAPGVQLVDSPQFPKEFKAGATAARDYLNTLKKNKILDWTFLSPGIEMHHGTSGTRKGVYRTGLDNPVFDNAGHSVISVEDIAVAFLDELKNGQFIKKRFTAAY